MSPLKRNLRLFKTDKVRGLLGLILIPIALLPQLHAQEIKLRLLDGRTGKPIEHSCINVWVGDQQKSALALPTDEKGIARFHLTSDATAVNVTNYWAACGMFGVSDPTVMYADTIQVNAGYVWCNPNTQERSWLAISKFPTRHLTDDGEVTANACGKVSAKPTPGELTIYVRPLTFWEKLKQ
jgi:hypothetical protein